ncbi:MAG: glycosyltransferase, partial [Phenylobacterium sp.]
MRILFLAHQFMPEFSAGTERVTLNLARAAQAEGHHVEVFTTSQMTGGDWKRQPNGLRSTLVEGVPVFAVPPEPASPLEDLGFRPRPQVRRLMESFLDSRPKFHLAHVMHAMRLADAVGALRARRLRYVVTLTDFFTICHRINLIRLDGGACEGPRGGRNCQAFCWANEIAEPEYAARTERLRTLLAGAALRVAVSDFVAERFRAEHPDLGFRVVPNGVDLLRFPRPRRRAGAGPVTFGYLGT